MVLPREVALQQVNSKHSSHVSEKICSCVEYVGMDPLDAFLSDAEELLSGTAPGWPEALPGPTGPGETAQNTAVFDLVHSLDLVDDSFAPAGDAVPASSPGMHHDAMNVPAPGAPQGQAEQPGVPGPVWQLLSKEAEMLEKVRARNRRSQARFREKTKVRAPECSPHASRCAAHAASPLHTLTSHSACTRRLMARGCAWGRFERSRARVPDSRWAVLQSQVIEAQSRISQVQSSLAAGHERRTQLQAQHSQLQLRCSNLDGAWEALRGISGIVEVATANTGLSMSAPVSSSVTPTRRSRLFNSAGAPPPLHTIRFHRGVSYSQLREFCQRQDLAAPHFVFEHGSAEARFNLRILMNEFRACEVARCGCGASNIVWYCVLNKSVGRQCSNVDTSLQQAGSGADGGDQKLSMSTTLNSAPCIGSYIAQYIQLSIENTFAVRAVELLKGVAPGVLPCSALIRVGA